MTGAPVVVATASVMSVAGVTKALGEEGAEFFRDAVQGGGEPGLGRGRHAVHRDRDVDGVARLAVGRDRNGSRCHAFPVEGQLAVITWPAPDMTRTVWVLSIDSMKLTFRPSSRPRVMVSLRSTQ